VEEGRINKTNTGSTQATSPTEKASISPEEQVKSLREKLAKSSYSFEGISG
jgi:hypothetical protein